MSSNPVFYPSQPAYNTPNGYVHTQQPYPQQQPTIIYQQQPQQSANCCQSIFSCCSYCVTCMSCVYLSTWMGSCCCNLID
ncbi:unnamed protein product [Caenorhabditis bovis]|uniref:Uncharacterized protein n=1 Tax=Caenorhabditis bovis TaxID=2654633 RepID=A0A8S1F8K6_9PELO|nr:unnamed protein product [Caenorhabditis bovis]